MHCALFYEIEIEIYYMQEVVPLRILVCFFALRFCFSINTWQSHALITALHIICLKITERLFFWTALKGFNGLAYNCIFPLVFYYVQNYGVITEAGIVDRTSSTCFSL